MLNSYVDTFVESMTFDNCKNNIPTVTTIILLDVSLEIFRSSLFFFFFGIYLRLYRERIIKNIRNRTILKIMIIGLN